MSLASIPTTLATWALVVVPAASAHAASLPVDPDPSGTPPALEAPAVPADPESDLDDGRGTPYRVSKDDNICGLDEPRQLSNPAKVDYDALLEATPEVKTIRDKKIDPDSAKGIELMSKARRRVLTAVESVRSSKGHCSVWKKIERRDGAAIPDLTSAVQDELANGE